MKKVYIAELDAHCQLISSYDDLKRKDILSLVRNAYQLPGSMEVKIQLLRDLFIAPEHVWAQLEDPINHEQLWRLIQSMDWVYKGPEYRPVEFIRIRGKNYLLPDEQLHSLGTAEFVIATAHLIGFHAAKDDQTAVKSLAKFTATIARPKPDALTRLRTADKTDPRESYHSVKCDRRFAMFEKIDLVTQIMIAQWFNNAANKMLVQFGMAGGGDSEGAPLSQGIFVGDWERQVVRVAESAVFGNYDAVMARPLTDILAFIELKNDEIRKQNEANRKKHQN